MWNVPGTFLIFRAIVSLYIYKTPDLFLARQYFCYQEKYLKLLYCISGPLKVDSVVKINKGNEINRIKVQTINHVFFVAFEFLNFQVAELASLIDI